MDLMKSFDQPRARRNIKELATNFDNFGNNFQFKLPGNRLKQGTVLGCFFTTLLMTALLLQMIFKGTILFGFQERMTVRTYDEGYFNNSHVLSSDDGIKFAFAITDFDSNKLITEDLDYGRVVAKMRSWG